jgi:putative SOS response-associated peptidase YedK
MCERFYQYVKPENSLSFISPKITENGEPKRPVSLGKKALVMLAENAEMVEMPYGFNKRTNAGERLMLNARAEGALNKENSQNYEGEMGIHKNGWAMEGFYAQRALIPITSFVEGPAGKRLKKPYDVSLKGVDQFYLAAIVDEDFVTGNLGFCVITCWPNSIMQDEVGYQRMPVILEEQYAKEWLNPDADITDLLPMLKPYSSELMEVKPLFG